MTEAEFKKHLDAAEKSPKEIAAAVSGLSEKVLRYKPSPEKWCVLEILGHLADIEIVYGYRLRQVLADASDLSKSAFHPELQREIKLAELVERMGGHGAGHLQQIEKLTADAGNK